VATLEREVVWKAQEVQNDAIQWGVDVDSELWRRVGLVSQLTQYGLCLCLELHCVLMVGPVTREGLRFLLRFVQTLWNLRGSTLPVGRSWS
jgi:hypothetical protein